MTKRVAASLKFSSPAIITSREVIIATYDAIFDHLERTHLYNEEAITLKITTKLPMQQTVKNISHLKGIVVPQCH